MHTANHTKDKWFTIVESLVAIVILVLAVTGATSAIQIGISSYIFSKDQTIAFFLAQEGFEQIRNIRDENSLKGQNWLTGIANSGDPCEFGKICRVDPIPLGQPFLVRCGDTSGSCPVLRQSPSGFFGYNSDSSWTDTIFMREVMLTSINAKEVSILVTVNWSKGVVNRQFKVRENILNWQ